MTAFARRSLIAAMLGATAARAQPAWPEHAVRLVVPFPPGGSNDIVARLLAEALRERGGQPVLVENRAGAGGNIGADAVAKAAPDGHTLLLAAPGPFAINEHLYRSMPYDPARDLVPVALVAAVPIVLVVPAESPARTLRDLIASAKQAPGRLAFGSSSIGGTNHLAGELLKDMAGIDIVHVPYRGAAPAMTDLVAGRLQFYFDNMPGVLPQIRDGRIRALAVAGAARAAVLPAVPTMAEAGLPGFAASAWFGLAAPGGTPPALAQRIGEAVLATLTEPSLREKLAAAGAEPGSLGPAGFARFVAAERLRWGEVVRASGARAE
ncbi:Bug family tripartite tricarboxylate transporter substrate binding protein [Paracraurococcus lichenis]|uniref:Tripartite tricarboxylate transporter substrate binding protein n=1 Tax=Paracraurococcus lichenis TaxID=3064888 RepID=A0ABT9E6K3_9PROT|nr:tripartite tricarboxylate transporter substrate binding protein [Paracraurococcus sp. LOR1-02]MDO9711816.1 tripartite tricarboxylate transporter substrate binding protein [Paracraurococcus sp. LOR1-02]